MKKRLLFSILAAVAYISIMPGTVWSQADTVPVALQSRIIAATPYFVNRVNQFEYCPSGVLLATESFHDYGSVFPGALYLSTDNGESFHTYDTSYPNSLYILAHEDYALYRFHESDTNSKVDWFQISWDRGLHWGAPEGLYSAFDLNGDFNLNVDLLGDRLALLTFNNTDSVELHLASNFGSSTWATHSFTTNYPGLVTAWADAIHGVYAGSYSHSGFLLLTSDGGNTWYAPSMDHVQDSIFNRSTFSGVTQLFYPYSGIIIAMGTGMVISRDTGKTWQREDSIFQFDPVLPNRWIASANAFSYPAPVMSTDSGRTWHPTKYIGPLVPEDVPNLFSFKDSLHGLATNGFDIVASTSDGGYTWQTLDSSEYMFGTVLPAVGLDSAYYSFSPYQDSLGNGFSAFFTYDRGATWQSIISNAPAGYAFAGLDSECWVGGTGFARIASLYDIAGTTFIISRRDSTRITAINKNFVWVSDGNELHAASNTGMNVSWGPNLLVFLPQYDSSASYRVLPVTRNVVFVEAPDTAYLSTDGGIGWSPARRMPDHALDATHWFLYSGDSTAFQYTTDGGISFRTISLDNANAQSLFTVDTARWYMSGYYTTDAGRTWQHIPGWDPKRCFYPVDAATAFGEPFAGNGGSAQILWRLDLPFGSSPNQGLVGRAGVLGNNFSISPLPDPVTGSEVSFQLSMPEAARVSITIYDALGREVGRAADDRSSADGVSHAAGLWQVPFDVSRLANGTYTCRVIAHGVSGVMVQARQFIIQR